MDQDVALRRIYYLPVAWLSVLPPVALTNVLFSVEYIYLRWSLPLDLSITPAFVRVSLSTSLRTGKLPDITCEGNGDKDLPDDDFRGLRRPKTAALYLSEYTYAATPNTSTAININSITKLIGLLLNTPYSYCHDPVSCCTGIYIRHQGFL